MERFVLVTGTNYCGSTLLAMLLGGHSRITTIGEMTGLMGRDANTYQCSCGMRLPECDFWLAVIADLKKKGVKLNFQDFQTSYKPLSQALLYRFQFSNLRMNWMEDARDIAYQWVPACRAHQDAITNRNLALAESILNVSGKDIFIDTSKNPNRVRPLLHALGDKLIVIHLIRDGRDVVMSTRKYRKEITHKEAIKKWKRVNETIARVMRYVASKRRCIIRYEDLTTDPAGTLKRLCHLIGVDYEPSCVDLSPRDQHIIGNTAARLGGKRSIEKTVSDRKGILYEENKLFERMAGALSRRYGYF